MLFTQFEFFVLMIITLFYLYYVKSFKIKKRFLLLVSYYFYSYWDWRFLGLIIISTVIDYTIGNLLLNSKSLKSRKLLVATSVICNLSILGFFKYYNFFLDSFYLFFSFLEQENSALNIILPVGISFYTFQSLSYTIDIYRKKIKPTKSFFDFALYVSFFPQLVAGPIIRAVDFLPQLESPRKLSRFRLFKGSKLFIFGLFKKSYIADNLAEFIDFGFANPEILNALTLLIVTLAYGIQIYCDFSGYSDMAIGIACIMGYDFKSNFNYPYIAQNIQIFWRRWHISLSSWLKDYLYIPLGGNRKGTMRTYINLLVTMLLGGLWHGASWNFIFWGFWHGLGLSIHRFVEKNNLFKISNKNFLPPLINSSLKIFFTLSFVSLGWVFFRASDFNTALIIINKIIFLGKGYAFYNPFAIFVIIIFFFHYLALIKSKIYKELFKLDNNGTISIAVKLTMALIVIVYKPGDYNPFIYFQF